MMDERERGRKQGRKAECEGGERAREGTVGGWGGLQRGWRDGWIEGGKEKWREGGWGEWEMEREREGRRESERGGRERGGGWVLVSGGVGWWVCVWGGCVCGYGGCVLWVGGWL